MDTRSAWARRSTLSTVTYLDFGHQAVGRTPNPPSPGVYQAAVDIAAFALRERRRSDLQLCYMHGQLEDETGWSSNTVNRSLVYLRKRKAGIKFDSRGKCWIWWARAIEPGSTWALALASGVIEPNEATIVEFIVRTRVDLATHGATRNPSAIELLKDALLRM